MRTTLDLPDELLRQAKARAAVRGMKLKDFVAEALSAALYYPNGPQDRFGVAEGSAADSDSLVLGEDCVFPLIRGEGGPAMKEVSGKTLNEILEEEEVERTHVPRGR